MKFNFSLSVLLYVFIFCGQVLFPAENEAGESEVENKLYIMPLASYNYINLEKQSVHIPGFGMGFIKGDYGKDFTDINQCQQVKGIEKGEGMIYHRRKAG
jgi:hypothetical protein